MSLHSHCLKQFYDEWHSYSVFHIRFFIKWDTKVTRKIHIKWASIFNGLLHLLYFLTAILFNRRLRVMKSFVKLTSYQRVVLEPNPTIINPIILCLHSSTPGLWIAPCIYNICSCTAPISHLPKHLVLCYLIFLICAVQVIHFQINQILVQVLFLHRHIFSTAAADLDK